MPIAKIGRCLSVVAAVASALVFSTAPATAAQASAWKVGYYTPSGRALSMASADSVANGLATFGFTSQPNTALLVTDRGSSALLGDDRGKTVTVTFDIQGASAFTYWGEDTDSNPCGTPANTRLFFETSNAGGFDYTHYWWSDTAFSLLHDGSDGFTTNISPVGWSDWNGQPAETNVAAFNAAASNVTLIGLSFGGGCFFENGVGTVDGSGTFNLDSFSVS